MITAARAAVLWERVWVALWPGLGLIGLYFVLALTGVLDLLPSAVRVLLLFIIGGVLFRSFWLSFDPVKMPGWFDGARRLERDSGLANRPLTEGRDNLAAGHGDPFTEALWRAHVLRLLGSAKNLRLRLPSPHLGRHDPYRLRFAVLAGIVLGVVLAGPKTGERLLSAVMPPLNDPADAVEFNAWISPPPYTGQPPRTLAQGTTPGSGEITIPWKSTLVLRVRDNSARPRLTVSPSKQQFTFKKSDAGYEAKLILNKDVKVQVRIGAQGLGDWGFTIVPDKSPTIGFAEVPKADQRNGIRLAYKAADDYGVVNAVAKVVPVINPRATPLMVPLAPPANARQVTSAVTRDLTSNPYAGTEVNITLIATDAAGQNGESKPMKVKLPERIFTHPLARALIEQRKAVAI
jgi:uncharacterized protein (TIGR02302 family)